MKAFGWREWLLVVLVILALQVGWTLLRRPAGEGLVYLPSRPSGAKVYRLQAGLFVNQSGTAAGGTREVEVGTTPGPLKLTYHDFPATLVLRLAGYHPLECRLPAGTFAPGRTWYPQTLELEPSWPAAPLLYGLRDLPALPVLGLIALWQLWMRRLQREALALQTSVRKRQRQGQFQSGDRVGPYQLQESVGRGAMGRVFRAVRADDPQGEVVAVKILFDADPRAAARLEGEVNALRRLSHPNLVPLLDWGQHEGCLYLVMEFVEGETLADWLERARPEQARCLEWFRQLAAALAAAHRAGVLHRDVNPRNIVIGPDGRAILMDFGIARRSNQDEHSDLKTAGTPGYMAPEQLSDQADWRSDLYSLGAVMYRCLAGRPPFAGNTAIQVLQNQRQGRMDPLQDVPEDLAALVHRLLQVDPRLRAASPEELLADLTR